MGTSLAVALAGRGLRLALLDARGPGSWGQGDGRALALGYGSRRILEALGVWSELADPTPIRKIVVSDRGHWGRAHITAADGGLDALGYVVRAGQLALALERRLAACADVERLCPAVVEDVALGVDGAQVVATTPRGQLMLNTQLLVAADGVHSAVRTQLALATRRRAYGQGAVVSELTLRRPLEGTALERFTREGAVALLPLDDHRGTVICTVSNALQARLMTLDDSGFERFLHSRFGDCLGVVDALGPRHSYPLTRVEAADGVRSRLAIIGNAAHTLHPIAGQGLNLGMRDVAALAQVVAEAQVAGLDWGSRPILSRYTRLRWRDQRCTLAFTEGLLDVFAPSGWPFALARNLGLTAFDHAPWIKGKLARRAMGLAPPLLPLMAGEPLPAAGG